MAQALEQHALMEEDINKWNVNQQKGETKEVE
jgi:hypothetical protein